MNENFFLEIVSPEKSFLKKDNVTEVVVPAFEGEMGILKDHISIISFLKPGIVKIISGSEEENFYVDDGIVEFKDNLLSILTSNIFNIKNSDKEKIQEMVKQAEADLTEENLDDQKRFMTPKQAINLGADYIVIGRPITQSSDPLRELISINSSIE